MFFINEQDTLRSLHPLKMAISKSNKERDYSNNSATIAVSSGEGENDHGPHYLVNESMVAMHFIDWLNQRCIYFHEPELTLSNVSETF